MIPAWSSNNVDSPEYEQYDALGQAENPLIALFRFLGAPLCVMRPCDMVQGGFPPGFFKTLFDKGVVTLLPTLSLPILLPLKIAHIFDGILVSERKRPYVLHDRGVSGGNKKKKWKSRLMKTKYIEPEGAKRHDWDTFCAEWTPEVSNRDGHVVNLYRRAYLHG